MQTCTVRTLCEEPRRLVYARTKNIRAVQLLLGHTKIDNTIRYLGIEIEDAIKISRETDC